MLWQRDVLTPLIPKYFLSKRTMSSEVAISTTQRPMTAQLPLPPEIRNLIYIYMLTGNTDSSQGFRSSIAGNEKEQTDVCRPSTSRLSILLVSRETFLEAYPIYYRVNLFYFPNVNILRRFLKNIGLARRQHVTRICFSWTGVDAKKTCRLLMRCPRLTFVDIVLSNYNQTRLGSPGLPKATECAFLREVRGLETVAFTCDLSTRYGSTIYNQFETAADLEELCDAMRRPRLDRFKATSEAEINPLKPKREIYKGEYISRPAWRQS